MPAPKSGRGRPRRYCTDGCREEAKARRRLERSTGWTAAAVEMAEIPADPLTHRRQTLESIADLLDGAPAAPPEDRLAQALIEARTLSYALRRLAVEVAPPLRARALGLATAITDALRRHFHEVLP